MFCDAVSLLTGRENIECVTPDKSDHNTRVRERPDETARGDLDQIQPRKRKGHQVFLNVYDLEIVTASLNDLVLRWNAGLGTFHCGVEVLGEELYFAYGESEDSGVVVSSTPRRHSVHIFRESIPMGESTLSRHAIIMALVDVMKEWPANSYHPIARNCVTFSETLCNALGAPMQFPGWVRGVTELAKSDMLFPVADYTWTWIKWFHEERRKSHKELSADSSDGEYV